MISRFSLPLLAAAAVLVVCGPRANISAVSSQATQESNGELSAHVRVDTDTAAQRVRFSLALRNGTARAVDVEFPSGKTHEFVVLDAAGREVWRWSDGRLFTQLLQSRILGANEALTFDERWEAPLAAGRYTLVALLLSSTHPVERRVEFAVP
jgi:hypothetical protein